MAERYLTRAVSVTSNNTDGRGNREDKASAWIALMEFFLEKRPDSRYADSGVSVMYRLVGEENLFTLLNYGVRFSYRQEIVWGTRTTGGDECIFFSLPDLSLTSL